VSHFIPCVGHKVLEDVHEDSMQFPNHNSRFLCNRQDGPLKALEHPSVSRSFSIAAVRTTEQHSPDTRSSYSKFDTELDFSLLPSVLEYSGFPLRTQKGVTVKTVRTLGQAVRTWSCFGKNCAIQERRSQKTVRRRVSYRPNGTHQSPIYSRTKFSVSL
jgi:hypothetical protein